MALVGLLGAQVFVDLLTWRSWLTTTGTLFGLAAGVVALTAGRPVVALAAGLFALGFMETGAFALGVFALALGPRSTRVVGGALVAAAGVALFPAPLAGALTAVGIAAALWGAWPWLVTAAAAAAPPLLGVAAARQYALEAWTVTVAGLALVRPASRDRAGGGRCAPPGRGLHARASLGSGGLG